MSSHPGLDTTLLKKILLWNSERYVKMGWKSQISAMGSEWNPFFTGIQNIEFYDEGGVATPKTGSFLHIKILIVSPIFTQWS